jgi:hypothetical protein
LVNTFSTYTILANTLLTYYSQRVYATGATIDKVNQRFTYETTDNIDGVVGGFTQSEEIHHDAVPSPVGALTSLAQARPAG